MNTVTVAEPLSTPDYTVVIKALHHLANQPEKMGRAGYETTYVCNDKDSAAADAIAMHEVKRAEAAKIAAIEAAEAAEAKFIRSKKSRGIVAARKAAKDKATSQAGAYESEGDSDKTTKP
ncbi:hypothetical protein J4E89_001190 [Alternaria sp. Ai002NY15]|nr:hypothetical protein J4E89_001190 [Alternaria sp. Ai002NY15]